MKAINTRGRFAALMAAGALVATGALGAAMANATEPYEVAQSGDQVAEFDEGADVGEGDIPQSDDAISSEEEVAEETAERESTVLREPASMSLDNVTINPDAVSGPCRLETYVTGEVLNFDPESDATLHLVATEQGEEAPAFTEPVWVQDDGSFEMFLWVGGHGEVGNLVHPSGTVEIDLVLSVGDAVADSWNGSFTYELTAGCATLSDIAWSPNPVKIIAPAKSAEATISGRVNIPEGDDSTYRVYLVDHCWGEHASADVAVDGSWAITVTALPPVEEGCASPLWGDATSVDLYRVDGSDGWGTWITDAFSGGEDPDFAPLVVEYVSAPGGGGAAGGTGGSTSGSGGELAKTGANLGIAFGGLAALAAGAGALALNRRRA